MSRSHNLSEELLDSAFPNRNISVEELLENVEENIEQLTDQDYHYSLDVLENGSNSIRLAVYGVEGFEKPARQTVAEAVSNEFGWKTAYEDGESTNSHYDIRVLEWKE